jgi:hypothetical protein
VGRPENLRAINGGSPIATVLAPMSVTNAALALERMFTVHEIATLWQLSPQTIRATFADEPGVLKIGAPAGKKGRTLKRSYFTLRIPASVVERVYLRLASRRS